MLEIGDVLVVIDPLLPQVDDAVLSLLDGKSAGSLGFRQRSRVESVLPADGDPTLAHGRDAMVEALAKPEWNSERRSFGVGHREL